MDDDQECSARPSNMVLAGALTQLAQYLAHDGSRSAFLAAILFEQFAADEAWSVQVRDPAREIAALLERSPRRSPIDSWWAKRQAAAVRPEVAGGGGQ